MDLIYLALLLALFALSFALIPALARLHDQHHGQAEPRK